MENSSMRVYTNKEYEYDSYNKRYKYVVEELIW